MKKSAMMLAGISSLSLALSVGISSVPTALAKDNSGKFDVSKFHLPLSKKYAGTTITVILPPWDKMAESMVSQFTEQTGIHVDLQIIPYDNIITKIITAEAAGTAPADVTEMDSSWVGQFSSAGWYTPLNDVMPKTVINNSVVRSIFTVNNQLIGIPYDWAAYGTILNFRDFTKAGITTVPQTWSELIRDAEIIKSKGIVKYPIEAPMSVTEGTSDTMYQLIKAAGGELFGPHWNIDESKNSPWLKALNFERTLYAKGLVTPGEISLTDTENNSLFMNNQAAINLTAPATELSNYLDPKISKIANDDPVLIPTPGYIKKFRGRTFVLTEALGIPKLSSHKEAAAMFIEWWMEPETLAKIYMNQPELLPPEEYALEFLNSEHKLIGGKQILQSASGVSPLFAYGSPPWYEQFSNALQTVVNTVVQGKGSPQQELTSLAAQVKQIRQSQTK